MTGSLPNSTGAMPANGDGTADVLFVDLDGTLITTHLWQEAIFSASHPRGAALWSALKNLRRGPAAIRRAILNRAAPDPSRLPLREEVIQLLTKQRALGVRTVLITTADQTSARAVADPLGLFDDVLAGDGQTNLEGRARLQAIEAYCRQHDLSGFDYVGDSSDDLPIWEQASRAYVVAPTGRLLAAVRRVADPAAVFGRAPGRLGAAVRALRPQQWVKNLLVFAPLLLAHEFSNVQKLVAAVVAWVAFCACASAGYVVNDLLDLEADRHHPGKRRRPFASGSLPLSWGPPLAAVCLSLGLLTATIWLPVDFLGVLILYVVLVTLYSAWLKQTVLVDVLVLAGLYTLRVFGGGLATDVPVSEWLMAFSLFLFLSLAFAKRYSELSRLAEEGKKSPHARGYQVSDLGLIESLGPTNGCLAVLVFALYVNSDHVKDLYTNQWALWLVCPLLLYWISRVWIKAKRGELPEDPVLFSIKDRISLLVAVFVLILVAVACPK